MGVAFSEPGESRFGDNTMEGSPLSVPPSPSRDVLERITLQKSLSLDLQVVLVTITQGLLDEFDGAFAGIRLLGPGDLCADG
jgi:hypothetical protein